MTVRERFKRLLDFKEVDMLPRIEWAAWWWDTVVRWQNEGLDKKLGVEGILNYFNMDNLVLLAASPSLPAPKYHGGPIIECADDYMKLRENAYSDNIINGFVNSAKSVLTRYEKGDFPIRIWLDGFFWYPRRLFGIEGHFYAFYDQPELMHLINEDLANFNIRAIEALYTVLAPEMVGMAEDMSYNHGPMLSHDQFTEFLTPYYKRMIDVIKLRDTKVLIDSDGDITKMVPWMREAGIEGVYPLERQAGVDLNILRKNNPDLLMLGGYDKMVMPLGEEAMRAEFERIMPVVRSGGYIMSVDHQTPPGVSFENYKIFARLYNEYARSL